MDIDLPFKKSHPFKPHHKAIISLFSQKVNRTARCRAVPKVFMTSFVPLLVVRRIEGIKVFAVEVILRNAQRIGETVRVNHILIN